MGGPTGLSDGWRRFDSASHPPKIAWRAFSTQHDESSSGLPIYPQWTRAHEQPKMSDAEFLAAEEYDIVLKDFRERFGPPAP